MDVRFLVTKYHYDLDMNATWYGQSLFFMACQYGRLPIAKELVLAGADTTLPSSAGQSPFWIACCRGHTKLATWLGDEQKADLEKRSVDKRSPLWIACWSGKLGCVQYVERALRCCCCECYYWAALLLCPPRLHS